MGQEKRPFGMRLESELYGGIERQAKREGRSPANLGEVLLTWAFRQLQIAGNSIALLESSIAPVPRERAKRDMARLRKAHESLTADKPSQDDKTKAS
jgi:hypothetical protein